MKKSFRKLICVLLAVVLLAGFSLPAHATELKTGIGVVTASSLRLRASASTDSKILDTATCGDSVVIIREVDDWYLVNFNLQVGYMHKDYIEFNEKKNVKLGYAMFDTASNVRKGPDTDTGVVDQAPKNETCFIIGFNCGWYKVSYNGQIGYVRSDLVTLLELPYSNADSQGNTYKEGDAKPEAAKQEDNATKKEPEKTTSSSASSASSSSSSSGSSSQANTSSQSSSSSSSGSSSSGSSSSSSNELGDKVVAFAKKYVGYRYVFGGTTPSGGFDCSGFVYYVYKQMGRNVGRLCTNQLSAGTQVSRKDLKPGDIVVFERTYNSNSRATHSGIYIGNGQFIHAANTRLGVCITSIDTEYYLSRLICGVHVR